MSDERVGESGMGEGAERVSECVWDQALSARVGQSIVWVERFRVIEVGVVRNLTRLGRQRLALLNLLAELLRAIGRRRDRQGRDNAEATRVGDGGRQFCVFRERSQEPRDGRS